MVKKLTEEEVRHIAKLANLPLSPEEVKKFQEQLSSVLEYIDILSKVDTASVTPTSQVTNLQNVLREDEPKPSLTQDKALSNAPKVHKGLFKVDAIF